MSVTLLLLLTYFNLIFTIFFYFEGDRRASVYSGKFLRRLYGSLLCSLLPASCKRDYIAKCNSILGVSAKPWKVTSSFKDFPMVWDFSSSRFHQEAYRNSVSIFILVDMGFFLSFLLNCFSRHKAYYKRIFPFWVIDFICPHI